MSGWRFVADLVATEWSRSQEPSSAATSITLACRSMGWDLRAGRWDGELLALVGLRPEQMPRVVPWTEPAARLGGAASNRLGLPAGIPIAVAGHDHVVGGLAVGVSRPGDVLDSIGTAEAILLVTSEPALDEAVRAAGFSVGSHVLPGRWTLIAGLQTSGAFVDWFLDLFGGVPETASDEERYERLEGLVAAAIRRPSGIVGRPTLRGRTAPAPDAGVTASFEGLTAAHRLPDLALAALEGTAFHVRWMEDELERLSGQAIARVRTIGGGTANETLLEIKAALSPAPLELADVPEAVAVGAALVGAVAGDLLGEDAVVGRSVPVRAVAPDPGLATAYDEIYRARFLRSPEGAAVGG
jgi:sugar (pentulose or hexulose) kinase